MKPLSTLFESPRRSFGDTLAELAGGVLEASAGVPARATEMELCVPVELCFGSGGELVGDFPLYRRSTRFDTPPARVTVRFGEICL